MGEICRKFCVSLGAAVAVLIPAAPAMAAGSGVAHPSAADVSAAVATAGQPRALSFARSNFRQVDHAEPGQITVSDKGIPVYTLNPDFVVGTPDAPAGVLRAIAVTATAESGAKATLRAAPSPNGWTVGNVLSGNDEERLSAKLRPGSVLLDEPQINGWYDLGATDVVLLQASLPQSPVGQSVPLADYQRAVHGRYADKLPGSAYQNRGGIGFVQNTVHPETNWVPAIVGGLLLLGVLVLVFVLWRVRKHRRAAVDQGLAHSS